MKSFVAMVVLFLGLASSAHAFQVQAYVTVNSCQVVVEVANTFGQPFRCQGRMEAYRTDGNRQWARFRFARVEAGSYRYAYMNIGAQCGWVSYTNASANVNCEFLEY